MDEFEICHVHSLLGERLLDYSGKKLVLEEQSIIHMGYPDSSIQKGTSWLI